MNDKLIETFDPLIKKIAKNFYGIDYDELIQVGRIGLYNAYNHYNKNSDTKFSTFAYQYIFGEMYNLAIQSKSIKPNREILKITKLVEKTKVLLTQKIGKEPSITDISIYLNIDEDIICNAISYTQSVLSLDKEQEEDSNLYNMIGTSDNKDLKIDIDDSFKVLESPAKEIIMYRYYNDMTQSETAKLLGLTQVTVSRIEKKSLAKMQKYLSCE